MKAVRTIVELQLRPRQAILSRSFLRNLPAEVRLIGNELPELVDQLAFVADIRLFTGIICVHSSVRNAILSNQSTIITENRNSY